MRVLAAPLVYVPTMKRMVACLLALKSSLVLHVEHILAPVLRDEFEFRLCLATGFPMLRQLSVDLALVVKGKFQQCLRDWVVGPMPTLCGVALAGTTFV